MLALCRPHVSDESDSLHVNFLVDVSQSVDLERAGEVLAARDAEHSAGHVPGPGHHDTLAAGLAFNGVHDPGGLRLVNVRFPSRDNVLLRRRQEPVSQYVSVLRGAFRDARGLENDADASPGSAVVERIDVLAVVPEY